MAVDNKVAVLVLQHPQEQDRVLGTARLLCATLGNARLTVGLSWRNLGHALGVPAEAKDWGVLYLGSTHATTDKGPLVALDRKGEPLLDQAAGRASLKGIVALDGNWAQAKALWWRNAWLTKLRRFVVIPDGPSLYGDLRREARPDAVSTLEAVALALSTLEATQRCGKRCSCRFATCSPRLVPRESGTASGTIAGGADVRSSATEPLLRANSAKGGGSSFAI